MAAPPRYTTATAFLEQVSTVDILSYPVPTSGPVDETAPTPALAQADHALYSSTFVPRTADGGPSTGFVLARVLEDGYALELRWVAFSRTPASAALDGNSPNPFSDLDGHPGTLPPVRFVFPSRLVPSPAFVVSPSSNRLQLLCLTEKGYLYNLDFSLASLFYDKEELAEGNWSEEFKVGSLDERLPVLVHGVDEGRVIVGCEDGHVVSVELAQGEDGALVETELRSPASFSMRSLIPSFSTRNFASPTKHARPISQSSAATTQLLSLASTPSTDDVSPIAFGVTRDRKLRIWNLDSGTCFRAIDLPRPASASTSVGLAADLSLNSPQAAHLGALLPPTPQPLVKVIAGNPFTSYTSYLALFSPASSTSPAVFVLYGFTSDPSTGDLSELTPVTERVCPTGALGALVDFQVQRMDLAGDAKWTLWTCWDENGVSELRTIGLSELESAVTAGDADGEEWAVVERGTAAQTARWTAAYFDDQLRDSSVSVADTFLRHIASPGRYPPATLEYALEMYEDVVLGELEAANVAAPDAFSLEYPTPLERAASVVGATVVLEQSPQTGAILHEEYNKQVKLEWLRFVAFLNESRAAALFPTCLVTDEQRGIAAVVGRDSIAVPIVREAVQTLQSLSTAEISASMADPQGLFDLPPSISTDYALRADILPLLAIVRSLNSLLSNNDLRNLNQTLRARLCAPQAGELLEDLALDLFEKTLEPALSDDAVQQVAAELAKLDSAERAVDTFVRLITTEQLPCVDMDGGDAQATTDLANGLLVEAFTTSIDARYELAKGLTALLLVVWAAEDEGAPESDAVLTSSSPDRLFSRLDQTTSTVFTALHALASLQWLAAEVSTPSPEGLAAVQKELQGPQDDPMISRFGELRMHESSGAAQTEVMPVPTYGLLSALLRVPGYAPRILPASRSSLPVALAYAVADTCRSFGVLPPASAAAITATPAATVLGMRLQQLELPRQAGEWVEMWPRTAGMSYVRGRALLGLLNGDEAQEAFKEAASGLYTASLDLDDDDVDDEDPATALSLVVPSPAATTLSQYYFHLVSLFVPTPFDGSIAHFAQLALGAFEQEGTVNEVVEKELWTKLFRSYAALGIYDRAYNAIMSTPYHETQMTCLAHFISVVCENGAASLLTTFSFTGLEADLERNLAFRARNSDPLASPNYARVLYAYHVAKGDYRSAATVMFQLGRRLGDLSTRSGELFSEIAMLQCQSYLAATNALSLVTKDHAWFAVHSGDDVHRGNKRRKLAFHIPEEEFDPAAATPPLEVIELADVCKEYSLALARLQLAGDFPELERTNLHLDSASVVALFSQSGKFDQAFATARVLDVELTSVFESLAERCVTLALNADITEDVAWVAYSEEAATWEGSLSSKAWRLLERHLERHDDPITFRYRIVALEQTLAINRGRKPPAFVTDFLARHDLPSLLRLLIKHDRLDDAFQYSLGALKTTSTPTTVSSLSSPYALYDQLLAIPPGEASSLSDDVLKQRQKELRDALEVRFAALDKADSAARRA
ncbi:uncharacterized protein JCM10292_004335 [Rhodotorula paludigena]|uniref:uncharacterized protein n=1 Tax=Rhodotorula paludigena TaxID=86838 RepID=UPI003177FBCC